MGQQYYLYSHFSHLYGKTTFGGACNDISVLITINIIILTACGVLPLGAVSPSPGVWPLPGRAFPLQSYAASLVPLYKIVIKCLVRNVRIRVIKYYCRKTIYLFG